MESQPLAADAPLAYLGAVFRITHDYLERARLLARVEAEVSPRTRALLQKLPGKLSWIDSAPLLELFEGLRRHGKPDALYDLGLLAGRELGGGMVSPVIKAAFAFFGTEPNTVFGNLDRFYALPTRGYGFSWRPDGERAGTVEVRWDARGIPASLFEVTRGNLQFCVELLQLGTQVPPAVVLRHDERGAWIRFAISW